MSLELLVLGEPRVRVAGQAVVVPPKRLALVTYVALTGAVRRSLLADLLWDEVTEEVARRNLRQELHRLKTTPLAPHLHVTAEHLELQDFRCDAGDFERLGGEEALALYQGELLRGLELAAVPRFEEWLAHKREALQTRWLELCSERARELEAAGKVQAALEYLAPLLAFPDEDATLRAMRLHASLGQHRAARGLYQRLQAQLAELGTQPSAELRELAERLRGPVPGAGESGLPTVEAGAGRASLDRPPLVGREAFLNDLTRWLKEGGKVVLLEGEPGNGKTSLAAAAAQQWGAALRLQGREEAMTVPFLPLTEALRSRLEALDDLPTPWRGEVARLLPELQPATPLEHDARQEGQARFMAALAEALGLALGGGVLWLEDLHWFDASTLEVLGLALRVPQRVIGTVRPLERRQHAGLERLLSIWQRRQQLITLEVTPLSETDTLRLIRSLAPPGTGGTRFARRLHQNTGGNPLFLIETLRTLLATEELREVGGQWHTDFDLDTSDYRELPLPQSVSSAILARLQQLSGTAGGALWHVLGAAALLGDRFTIQELAGSTPLGEWELLEALEQALLANLLVAAPGDTYRFTHALVQRTVEEHLSAERRRFLHRRLAATLEKLGASAARRATHLEGSGQLEQAAQTWIQAAEDAATIYAHPETLAHLGRALNLGPPDAQAYALHLKRAEVYRTLDDKSGWRAALEAARALAPGGQQAALDLRQIELDFYSARYTEVLRGVQEVLAGNLSTEQRGWAGLWRGNAYSRMGRMSDAMQAYAQALTDLTDVDGSETPQAPHQLELRGRLQNAYAYAASECGDLSLAQGQVAGAMQAFACAGHRRGQAMALNTAGNVEHLLGQHTSAAEFYQRSYEIALDIGDNNAQRLALNNLAGTFINLKQWDASLETVNKILELLEDVPDAYSEVLALERLYFIYLERQQAERALSTAQRWQQQADQHGFARWSVDARLRQSELLLQSAPVSAVSTVPMLLEEAQAHLQQLSPSMQEQRQQEIASVRIALSEQGQGK